MKIPPFLRVHSVFDSIQKGHIILSVAVDKEAILLFSSVCVSAGKTRSDSSALWGTTTGTREIFFTAPVLHVFMDVKNGAMVPCNYRSAEKKCKAAGKPGISHGICRPARRYFAPPT
jgi:hypothetical protein